MLNYFAEAKSDRRHFAFNSFLLLIVLWIVIMNFELIVLYVILCILFHELAHYFAFRFFKIGAYFALFSEKIFGINLPTGVQVIPRTWDHSVKKQYVISIVGFIASVIVSILFALQTPSFTEKLILIVFPVLLSLGDFKTILLMFNKPLNKSVKQAMLLRLKGKK